MGKESIAKSNERMVERLWHIRHIAENALESTDRRGRMRQGERYRRLSAAICEVRRKCGPALACRGCEHAPAEESEGV